ncbi:hypothetical protein GUITHDRAFT_100047 [Guillardia theta CCMP2712]|uniref:PDZ domain-containing protein n=1 Tax=Guillardia theta (strain CCMP2712) TaxID=905079 RepID=L1K2G5_GUITC|nr:hypothetical protein GUITHDRAFT_100047 [Guillardia theta CCMP2712]EKX54573.1 hypothetical protein GUITHDRAFT_100047 [Guillardia theta CCMP2712]|eukprot:XP_005841553.1 hypothetical protein GUITHDRAFT_100047 [Guillardia theta CCMP2712]
MQGAQGEEQFGVGIYFAEDVDGGQVFVQSLVPEGSAAMARTIQESDILVKINHQPTLHIGLARLREGTSGKLFYEVDLVRGSAGYVKLLMRCHSLATENDRMRKIVSMQEIKIEGLVAEKEELMKGNRGLNQDERQKMEKENLQSRAEVEKLAGLLENWKEKASKLEKMLAISQDNMKSREEHVNRIEELDRDRLAYVSELERRFQEDKQLQRTIQAKLQEDLRKEALARSTAEKNLMRVLAQLQETKQELTILKMREDNVRSRLETGHQELKRALKFNEEVGLELATLMGKMEDSHDYVIHELLRKTVPVHPFQSSSTSEDVARNPTPLQGL